MGRRLGAFSRALKLGMSEDDARLYSEAIYPLTADDAAYEAEYKRKAREKLAKKSN